MNSSIDIESALSPQSISSIDSLAEGTQIRNEYEKEEQQHPAHQEHLRPVQDKSTSANFSH